MQHMTKAGHISIVLQMLNITTMIGPADMLLLKLHNIGTMMSV